MINIPNSLKPVYQPRKSRLKSCNGKCTLDIPSLNGWSYGYWQVVKNIDGLIVFNDYSYSNTTSRHQSQLRNWLRTLKVSVDLVIECPNGLQSSDWAKDSLKHYAYKIGMLYAKIDHGIPAKNIKRLDQINRYKATVIEIRKLHFFKQSELNDILSNGLVQAKDFHEYERDRKKKERIEKKIQRIKNALIYGVL